MESLVDFPTELTPEALKNYSSAAWRLENLYYIKDETGAVTLFKAKPAQHDFFREMWYFNLLLKARQLGFTTAIDLFLLDVCVWNPNVSAAIIADSEDKAKDIFDEKVKFAYEHLPAWIRHGRYVEEENQRSIQFDNGSSITVGVGVRGLTFQYLHISELGIIANKYPAKADEIHSGAINTVHIGQFIFIESTAKGRDGLFFNLCESARNDQRLNRQLTQLAFKFHFYAWFWDARYVLPPEQCESMAISAEDAKYFAKVEQEMDCEISHEARCWYLEKRRTQQDEMKSEFPSTPDEAFESSGEGRIYRREMAKVREEGRILKHIPVLTDVLVNVFFDIGGASNRRGADYMACWFVQRVGFENRVIRFHQESGRGVGWWAKYIGSHGYLIGKIYLPHDAKHKRLVLADAGKSVEDLFDDAGFKGNSKVVVDKVEDKWQDGIGRVRIIFPTLVFDESTCSSSGMDKVSDQGGIECLDNYKKVWNDQVGAWRDQPVHDEYSHGADALETFARSDVAIGGYSGLGAHPTTSKKKRARNFRTV